MDYNLLSWLRRALLGRLLNNLECLRTALLNDLLDLWVRLLLNDLRRLLTFDYLLRRTFDADCVALMLHLAGNLGHDDLLPLLVDEHLLLRSVRLGLGNLLRLNLGRSTLLRRLLLQNNDGLLLGSRLGILCQQDGLLHLRLWLRLLSYHVSLALLVGG